MAELFNVGAAVIEKFISHGALKLCDARITEQSLRRFCARYGAIIKADFLDAETRDWLVSSMDHAPTTGNEMARGLESFRKHALVVRTCEHCGRAVRGNAFFRHSGKCRQRKAQTPHHAKQLISSRDRCVPRVCA